MTGDNVQGRYHFAKKTATNRWKIFRGVPDDDPRYAPELVTCFDTRELAEHHIGLFDEAFEAGKEAGKREGLVQAKRALDEVDLSKNPYGP